MPETLANPYGVTGHPTLQRINLAGIEHSRVVQTGALRVESRKQLGAVREEPKWLKPSV
jgi:hypothetical protein